MTYEKYVICIFWWLKYECNEIVLDTFQIYTYSVINLIFLFFYHSLSIQNDDAYFSGCESSLNVNCIHEFKTKWRYLFERKVLTCMCINLQTLTKVSYKEYMNGKKQMICDDQIKMYCLEVIKRLCHLIFMIGIH